MGKEFVKYHNDLNSVSMRKWTAEEMDLFFSVIAKIRDIGTEKVVFDAQELKILTGTETRNSYWFKMLDDFTKKAITLFYSEKEGAISRVMTLFQCFEFNLDKKTLEVEVSSRFEYIVNRLNANFSIYYLSEFTSLKSTYSKTMYRLIKQWKSLGEKEYNVEQFRELLDIPASYNISAINRQVIKQIQKELPQYFENFKIKILKRNTQGSPVIGYKFTWSAEKSNNQKWINGKYNKKSKPKIKDDRMTLAERKAFIEHKIKQNISFKPPEDEEIDGQIDVNYYLD